MKKTTIVKARITQAADTTFTVTLRYSGGTWRKVRGFDSYEAAQTYVEKEERRLGRSQQVTPVTRREP